jgi:hypothetical protein
MVSALLLPLLLASAASAAPTCKPVRTMAPFNISDFIAHKWFVQAQQPIIYLPKDEIYCVTADYKQTSASAVDVHNYANHLRVNGKVSDSGGTLQAIIPNKEARPLAAAPAPAAPARLKPEIHRVDPESGSTLRTALVVIFNQPAGSTCKILGQPCEFFSFDAAR